MKIILFYYPIPYPDFCEVHQIKCLHYLKFVSYDNKNHDVHYGYYCGKCHKEYGEDAVTKGKMTIKEWTDLFGEERTDN